MNSKEVMRQVYHWSTEHWCWSAQLRDDLFYKAGMRLPADVKFEEEHGYSPMTCDWHSVALEYHTCAQASMCIVCHDCGKLFEWIEWDSDDGKPILKFKRRVWWPIYRWYRDVQYRASKKIARRG